MAARDDIAVRKSALLRDLRLLHRDQGPSAGGTALKQRELSEKYGLSIRTVSLALQELVEEGVLYTVPRIGTFLGRPVRNTEYPYLIVSHHTGQPYGFFDLFQMGFEDRIAQLGGASLTLTEAETLWHLEQNHFPAISGVFEFSVREPGTVPASKTLLETGVAGVSFGSLEDVNLGVDLVNFDNEDGGEQAAHHMLSMGHRQIAFLALHDQVSQAAFRWSVQRERGWRRIMEGAGRNVEGLIFRPSRPIADNHCNSQVQAAREAALRLLHESDATAVVAVNVLAAQGLLQALRDSDFPMERWPSIVCFDSAPGSDAASSTSIISYLRLPWEKTGTEAAQLLWDRKNGRLTGPPQERLVPMQLVPRLSCRQDWAGSSGLAQTHANGLLPAESA